MKKTIIYIFTLLSFFTINSAYSQDVSKESENSIYGIWKLDFTRQRSEMNLSKQQVMASLEREQKESIDQTLSSKVYMFFQDGSFELQWTSRGQYMAVKGSFSTGRDNILRMSTKEYTLDYMLTLEGETLVLNPIRKTEGVTDILYLKKIE